MARAVEPGRAVRLSNAISDWPRDGASKMIRVEDLGSLIQSMASSISSSPSDADCLQGCRQWGNIDSLVVLVHAHRIPAGAGREALAHGHIGTEHHCRRKQEPENTSRNLWVAHGVPAGAGARAHGHTGTEAQTETVHCSHAGPGKLAAVSPRCCSIQLPSRAPSPPPGVREGDPGPPGQ